VNLGVEEAVASAAAISCNKQAAEKADIYRWDEQPVEEEVEVVVVVVVEEGTEGGPQDGQHGGDRVLQQAAAAATERIVYHKEPSDMERIVHHRYARTHTCKYAAIYAVVQ
jgi:hypothetical protein